MSGPLLEVRDLRVHFRQRRGEGVVKAVDGVSFTVPAGRTVALVGESGCGKSTTAYAVLGLEQPTGGAVLFDGRDVTHLDRAGRRALAGDMQIVFQDPSAALDPKMTVADSIGEPLAIGGWAGKARRARTAQVMDLVGLPAAYAERLPSALSGGQRQRVVIARALALSPRLLVLDEPVSALDVSIRSQILNLLLDLQAELGLAYLFISHDLSVVRHIADDVLVMYLGSIVERGQTDGLFGRPVHPYTEALLSAIPLPDPAAQRARARILLSGDPPSPLAIPPGCRFATRCPLVQPRCREVPPILAPAPATEAACLVRVPAADPAVGTALLIEAQSSSVGAT